MTEQLTDDERAWLDESSHVSAVRKALRIIDAYAAERSALAVQVEIERARVRQAVARYREQQAACEVYEARVRELEASALKLRIERDEAVLMLARERGVVTEPAPARDDEVGCAGCFP